MDWNVIVSITEQDIVGPEKFSVELHRRLDRVRKIIELFGGEPASRQIAAVVIEQWERDGRP